MDLVTWKAIRVNGTKTTMKNTRKYLTDSAHWVMPSGGKVVFYSMVVFYFGRLIALVNESGEILWRDHTFPKFLVEYLIESPQPEEKKTRWN
jgi:hypothetical protein